MRTAISMLCAGPVLEIGRERPAACGIDITAVAGAPGDELLRIEWDANWVPPLSAEERLHLLSLELPLVERLGEKLRIGHDLHDAGIVCAFVPGDANGISRSDILEHLASSSCGSASSHDSEGAGLRQSPRTPPHCPLCDTTTPGEIAACTCVDCPNRQKEAA